MEQTDIKRLFRLLASCQELDPEIAQRLLKRILEIVQELSRVNSINNTTTKQEYERIADNEML